MQPWQYSIIPQWLMWHYQRSWPPLQKTQGWRPMCSQWKKTKTPKIPERWQQIRGFAHVYTHHAPHPICATNSINARSALSSGQTQHMASIPGSEKHWIDIHIIRAVTFAIAHNRFNAMNLVVFNSQQQESFRAFLWFPRVKWTSTAFSWKNQNRAVTRRSVWRSTNCSRFKLTFWPRISWNWRQRAAKLYQISKPYAKF